MKMPMNATAIMVTAMAETRHSSTSCSSRSGSVWRREQPAVFDGEAGIVGGLADLHPVLLDGGRNQINRGEAETQSDGNYAIAESAPRSAEASRQ